LNRRLTPILALFLASIALAGCTSGGLLGEPRLSPEQAEAAFFEFADGLLPAGDTPGLVAAAEAICQTLEAGESRTVVIRTIDETGGSEISSSQAQELVALAIPYRCPEFEEQ